MKNIRFLTVEEVILFHTVLIDTFGGTHDVRDYGLLDSAIAQPKASFEGRLLHPNIPTIAAAYFFHIIQNHPFIDGNKRTGTFAALVFLEIHGYKVYLSNDEIYDIAMKVATSQANKEDVVSLFKNTHTTRH